ncbi:MAG: hypothetical protein MRY32_09965 [Rickettsiales bacterium]|nr:hypothetical protein [Rickettsiales bacterium]
MSKIENTHYQHRVQIDGVSPEAHQRFNEAIDWLIEEAGMPYRRAVETLHRFAHQWEGAWDTDAHLCGTRPVLEMEYEHKAYLKGMVSELVNKVQGRVHEGMIGSGADGDLECNHIMTERATMRQMKTYSDFILGKATDSPPL